MRSLIAAAAAMGLLCAPPPARALPPQARGQVEGLLAGGPLRPASGRLLVARTGLPDPNFQRSVVLLIDYGEDGAWGLILNRPTELPLRRLFPASEVFRESDDLLHFGGPVSPLRLFAIVRSAAPLPESETILPGLQLCTSAEAVEQAVREGAEARIFAGYAGWGPGQLDAEIARGDWHVLEAEPESLLEGDGAVLWETLVRRAAALVVKLEGRGPGSVLCFGPIQRGRRIGRQPMIVRTIKVYVKPEAREAFERATIENHEGSIREPGVLRFDVLRSAERPGEYLLYEVYASEQATRDHKETPHYKKWREAVAPMMAGDRESVAYEVVAPTDPNAW